MTPAPALAAPGTQRLHALDALRGFALLLGVALHLSLSWLPGAEAWWIIGDADPSPVLGGMFFWIHQFRMITFFLLAGYFGRLAVQRLGVSDFVRDRARRIVLPLIMAWPLVFGAIVAVVVWSAWIRFDGVLPADPPPGPAFTADDFPLTHLWFLYVLALFYAGMLLLRALLAALDRGGRVQTALDAVVCRLLGIAAPLLLAIPVAIVLLSSPDWIAWFGIPTPDQSLYPNRAACLSFGLAFALGWALQRQPALLAALTGRWALNLALAAVATLGCLAHVGTQPLLAALPTQPATLIYAFGYGVAAWAWTLGLIGLSQRFLSGFSPARRYLADASYWIYLAHLPVVMALQVASAGIDAPWWIEYPLTLGVAFALLLGSYRWMVRDGAIGRLLSGRGGTRHRTAGPALAGQL